MNWEDLIKENDYTDKQNDILTFNDYMDVVSSHPEQELRICCMYLKDMIDYYGKNDKDQFNLFLQDFTDSPPIHGQLDSISQIYNNLVNFCEEGFNNKFLLLIGPNGSSKSSLVKKIMKGAEDYSATDKGALYQFSWIFPKDNLVKGSLGLGAGSHDTSLKSYATLNDKDINAILPSELKDHPLLLVPIKTRQKLIEEILQDKPQLLNIIKKTYLYEGDLSKRNKVIFNALLKNYKGDHNQVYKHIRVEKFDISKRYSQGAVTIEPQMHVDARMQQITMDQRLSNLPPSLQSLNLFNTQGEIISANRGVLEFSDLLKRPLDTYKYLLMTMESKTINLQGILTELDIFFIGSSNEIHLSAFKQHPDFNSFMGRINFIRVPYLLNAEDEKMIYEEQVLKLMDKTRFEPHALETLCLYAVMTRIRFSQTKNYKNKKLGDIASNLSPLDKTLFYTYRKCPHYLNSEQTLALKQAQEEILHEFDNENLYEGKIGISPREVKQIIYELAARHENITFIEVVESLEKFIQRKNEYDFLNMAPQGEYHNHVKFLTSLQDHALEALDWEVRDSLGLVDKRSYEEYIGRYIVNINAHLKNEKLKNPITGQFEESNMYFIKEFESNIELNETPESFRSHLIAKLGVYSLDNPDRDIKYTEVFPDIVKKLQESFRKEQSKLLERISKNLVFYLNEKDKKKKSEVYSISFSEENKKLIEKVLKNLTEKFKYSELAAVNLLRFLIKKKY